MKTKIIRHVYQYRHFFGRFLPQRPILLNLKDFKMYVELTDWAVGGRIAVNRHYEAHVTDLLRTMIRPDTVLLDVGANIGYYTLMAAAHIGHTGKVISFEPGKHNCALIQMSLAANGFQNVELYPLAVSNKHETIGFSCGEGSSNGIIVPLEIALEQVEAVALDDFLAEVPHISILKMDIEGVEGRALQGMKQLIQKHHPLIFTEFNPAALENRSGMLPEAFLDALRTLNYDLHVLHRKGGQNKEPQNNAQIMDCFRRESSNHLDLIAYPIKS